MATPLRTKGIVLRRTNYGEADRILQVLTPANGVISVMARGVRREKSKLAGGVELFARADMTVHQGKGAIGILTSARIEEFFHVILQEYDRLQFAYEGMKLIDRAASTLDDESFFILLDQLLTELNILETPLSLVKSWYYLQLAIILGQGLNLSTDDHGMRLVEDAGYDFDVLQSVFVFREQGRFSTDHIKLLRILSAQSPRVAAHVSGVDSLLSDCLWVAERSVAH